MFTIVKRGKTSNILHFKLRKLSTGLGFTGLTSSSSGLIISTRADNEASPTNYTQGGSTIESVTTLGTYAAPTATKCRFREVDATNLPGVYEVQFADARFAVASSQRLHVSISGVTDLDDFDTDVMLWDVDPSDSAAYGVSAMPAQAASVRTAVGLASANLDTQLSGLSTATTASAVRTAVGLASANLDTQLASISAGITPAYTGIAQDGGDSSSIVLASGEARCAKGYIVLIQSGTGQYGVIKVGAVTGSGGPTPKATAVSGQTWQFGTPDHLSHYVIVQSDGLVPSNLADIFTTQLSESYASLGTAPTLAQALFMIMQRDLSFSISGTTITVKNLLGATVMTFTLDSATNPTSVTRAS